jgi:hypothetical protein
MKSLPTELQRGGGPATGGCAAGRGHLLRHAQLDARAAPQSKVRASGSVAAAREAALSAEVVELNRTSVTHVSELLDFVIVIALAHP